MLREVVRICHDSPIYILPHCIDATSRCCAPFAMDVRQPTCFMPLLIPVDRRTRASPTIPTASV